MSKDISDDDNGNTTRAGGARRLGFTCDPEVEPLCHGHAATVNIRQATVDGKQATLITDVTVDGYEGRYFTHIELSVDVAVQRAMVGSLAAMAHRKVAGE